MAKGHTDLQEALSEGAAPALDQSEIFFSLDLWNLWTLECWDWLGSFTILTSLSVSVRIDASGLT